MYWKDINSLQQKSTAQKAEIPKTTIVSPLFGKFTCLLY